ncbi:MAG: hypothetical protein IT225_05960 [Flavobacteriales bacterium]|jgi:hypothetical protein|nr:hypothetical protein [Flavobacteriales bacterium]
MKSHLWILAFGLLLLGCGKEVVDVSTLTTNPFDPAYAGTPVFEMIQHRTIAYTEDGVEHYRHEQDVRVRTDLMPSGAEFQVFVDLSPIATPVVQGQFTITREEATLGQTYCHTIQLANGGGHGAKNTVCATATL